MSILPKDKKESFALLVFTDFVKALCSLSEKKIIHWDLKLDNFMIHITTKDFKFDIEMLN